MPKALLFTLCALLLAGCKSVEVRTTAYKQPDIDRPGGHPPVAASEVRFIERKVGVTELPEPAGCTRVGAVYTNWGYGDWLDHTPRLRPPESLLVAELKARAGAMGANAIAWPSARHSDLSYAFAYRCAPV